MQGRANVEAAANEWQRCAAVWMERLAGYKLMLTHLTLTFWNFDIQRDYDNKSSHFIN